MYVGGGRCVFVCECVCVGGAWIMCIPDCHVGVVFRLSSLFLEAIFVCSISSPCDFLFSKHLLVSTPMQGGASLHHNNRRISQKPSSCYKLSAIIITITTTMIFPAPVITTPEFLHFTQVTLPASLPSTKGG